ncbi:MAG: hypothetical protein V4697_00795 [Patescibacteria group bacterium]
MKPVEKWKSLMFVGSLLVVALIIKSGVTAFRQQQVTSEERAPRRVVVNEQESRPRAESESRRKEWEQLLGSKPSVKPVLEDPAATRRAFLTRYVRPNLPPKSGTTIGVVVATDAKILNGALATAISNHLRPKKVSVLTGVFTLEFVSDGMFEHAFSGSQNVLDRLELAGVLDQVLLARHSVQVSTNPDLQNVMTASAQLEIVALAITGSTVSHSWTFSASGAGFKEPQARAMAEERLIAAIAAETNMLFTLTEPITP